jgi:hypothetical protein
LASLLNSLASGEYLAQRRLPTRGELFGGFGVRHEAVKSMKGARHDQEFGCDSGMDEPPRVLHVFFGEQVDKTDADLGGRQAGDAGYPGGDGCRALRFSRFLREVGMRV